MTNLAILLLSHLLAGLIGGSVMLLIEVKNPIRLAAQQTTEAVPSIRRHRRTSFPAVDHD